MNSTKTTILILAASMLFAAVAYTSDNTVIPSDSSRISQATQGNAAKLPKMIDLGSKSCIPCKKMAPILDSLREDYKGKAEIIFIDTKEDRQAAADYKITLIPTQIFFDTLGVEKFRHVGFYPADSIVTHLKGLGVK